jgi:hypothetical protein
VTAFFASAFYMVFFRFRALTPTMPKPEKLKRNVVYRICGLVMLVSGIAIGLLVLFANGASIF